MIVSYRVADDQGMLIRVIADADQFVQQTHRTLHQQWVEVDVVLGEHTVGAQTLPAKVAPHP